MSEKKGVLSWFVRSDMVNGKMKHKLTWTFYGVVLLFTLFVMIPAMSLLENREEIGERYYVKMVQAGSFNDYGNTTIGGAFGSFFTNDTWSFLERPSGAKYVVFTGNTPIDIKLFTERDSVSDLFVQKNTEVTAVFSITGLADFELISIVPGELAVYNEYGLAFLFAIALEQDGIKLDGSTDLMQYEILYTNFLNAVFYN